MPRFFFHEEGQDLPDIDSAEKKARDLAAELARDLTSEETTRNVSVEVQDERRQKLITVTVMMTVERYATGGPILTA